MSYELVDDDVKKFPRDRADMFAFGCVVFECMTGKLPWDELESDQKVTMALFKRKQPGNAPADAYAPLVDLMRRCWSIEPFDRPTSGEAAEELERMLSDVGGDPRDDQRTKQQQQQQEEEEEEEQQQDSRSCRNQ